MSQYEDDGAIHNELTDESSQHIDYCHRQAEADRLEHLICTAELIRAQGAGEID